MPTIQEIILDSLNEEQRSIVSSSAQRAVVIAGAGSGKTEVMARRVAWWVGVDKVEKSRIVAFTFTERAAEEMKFRIRRELQRITEPGTDVTLAGMYVGTIHGFCLRTLRDSAPDSYYNYDVLDEGGRIALLQRGFAQILGLTSLKSALGDNTSQNMTLEYFTYAYDLLNEYDLLDVELPPGQTPVSLYGEAEWCKGARLRTDCGSSAVASAFATGAARYYAYLHCRRFLDFSTSQSELLRVLRGTPEILSKVRSQVTHLVVDEVQDLNPVQDSLVRLLLGEDGHLTAVGDHRQAIYRFRGGRVDLMERLSRDVSNHKKGRAFELRQNYRSTPRVIDLANRWSHTIGGIGSLANPDMNHANEGRIDFDPSHLSIARFTSTDAEATWIASSINALVDNTARVGARHDSREGARGIGFSDIAVLIRSSTDARTYMSVLQSRGIPSVVRAGPDLFSQPEVLLFLGALAQCAGVDEFLGRLINSQITTVLGSGNKPRDVIRAAIAVLQRDGLPTAVGVSERLILAATLVRQRIEGQAPASQPVLRGFQSPSLRKWLGHKDSLKRIFPQELYQMVMEEAGVGNWEGAGARGRSALFHLGQLSSLVKMIETPGWNNPKDFKFQIVALYMWGVNNARIESGPLMVAPDAVTISTIHGVKGLEFAAVFLADVRAQRFPSNKATVLPDLPFEGEAGRRIDPAQLCDNANTDDERRLMYVALTRAERYLFVSSSGARQSKFFKELLKHVSDVGGTVYPNPAPTYPVPANVVLDALQPRRDLRFVTSFSDLRYFLECPHDFFLRKVLGFAPSIDQAFGYGRGVHNLLRAIHSDPARWAGLAASEDDLAIAVRQMLNSGLFFMRYTTGDPLELMRNRAADVVADYVRAYASELGSSTFEPEREFETLIEDEQILIGGAIDLIRHNDPPRVTLIDFKSGRQGSDTRTTLDEDEMRLQIGIYGLAAKRELEYEPEDGLVRYLGEADLSRRELKVDLNEDALRTSRQRVVDAARRIRLRQFDEGPTAAPRDSRYHTRCQECDFIRFCGLPNAVSARGVKQR